MFAPSMCGPAIVPRLLVAALVLAAGCAKKAGKDATATPASDASAPASIDDLEGELQRYEADLRSLGPSPDAQKLESGEDGHAPANAGGEGPGDDCSRICELATAICGLQDRICGLVAEHEDEARYTEACERATGSCETATEACDACRG